MDRPLPQTFLTLADIFENHGHKLYMIGGSSRDFLLGRECHDLDLCSDARVEEMNEFLEDLKAPYAHLGSAYLKMDGIRVDITTLREEDEYEDHRHPLKITFTDKIEKDYKRRDFTINAIYIDKDEKIYDFADGLKDLRFYLIRTIGNPYTRIVEDPLRILRALRFKLLLNFDLEPHLAQVLKENAHLLKLLNPDKVNQEIHRMQMIDENYFKLLKEFNILKSY